jgi:hypothetical protein
MSPEEKIDGLVHFISEQSGQINALQAALCGALIAASPAAIHQCVKESLEQTYALYLGESRNPSAMTGFEQTMLALLDAIARREAGSSDQSAAG